MAEPAKKKKSKEINRKENRLTDKSVSSLINAMAAIAGVAVLFWCWRANGCHTTREFMADVRRAEHRYDEEPQAPLPAWAKEADLNGDGKVSAFEKAAYDEENPRKKRGRAED